MQFLWGGNMVESTTTAVKIFLKKRKERTPACDSANDVLYVVLSTADEVIREIAVPIFHNWKKEKICIIL